MSEQFNLNNRYQFMGLIGKGRLGDVYRAGDNFFRREVALKMIHKETVSPEFVQYFSARYAQQIAVTAKLNHPSIIKTYDFTSLNGVPAWTMDLYSGANFSQYAGTKMSVEQAASLLIPVADALTYAHQYGVIHGNLKPSNILIGSNQEPVLTDFGLAQWLSENGHGYGQFEAEAGIGSPEYLAPEQGQGMPADPRTDVYSLGIIFYELITGRRPFTGMSPMDTMSRQISEPLPSPRYYVPNISQQAEQFLYQATAKIPAQRIGSMSEFAMMLRSLASPAAAGAYYPPASYYSTGAPTEDDDDDDDESLGDKLKAASASIRGNKNAKYLLILLLLLIVGLVIFLVLSNNRKTENANATATQEAINIESTQQAVMDMIAEQSRQTEEAEQAVYATQTQVAADAEATAQAIASAPTATLPPLPVNDAPVPTAAPSFTGRFQTQSPIDGTTFITGEAFTVSWRIENTGSSNWSQNFKLIFDGGTNFSTGAITEKSTGIEIWPGGAGDVTIPCTAPYVEGNYTMWWHIEDTNGNAITSPQNLSITINTVSGELTATPVPTAEPGSLPTPVEYDSGQS